MLGSKYKCDSFLKVNMKNGPLKQHKFDPEKGDIFVMLHIQVSRKLFKIVSVFILGNNIH